MVRRRAADLAGEFSRAARQSVTIAQERAVLRMLGVDGLDREGRPLAASLAARYCGPDRQRLARGVILPFVAAMIEYELPVRELALDVSAGSIDLGLEAETLKRPDRLAAAEKRAASLIDAAFNRCDANRTVSRDMREVLGLPDEPWLGVTLHATEVTAAIAESRRLVDAGVDVVAVRVPASWEFAEERRNAGLETTDLFEFEAWVGGGRGPAAVGATGATVAKGATGAKGRSRPVRGRRQRSTELRVAELVPAGSQRGLAALRKATDEATARRGCYASLMTVASAFAAPEQAVVAAFERVDYVVADPIREIVEDNVDPERALADHAFANRLQARAGCRVVVGPGPLVLGADLASGLPADAATRSGRGLALQALGVELALADGLPADRLFLGSVPEWVAAEADPASILVESWLRGLVFRGYRLVVDDPAGVGRASRGSAGTVAALAGGSVALAMHAAGGSVAAQAAELSAAAEVARTMRISLGDGRLHGEAAAGAERILRAANVALERLAADGWGSLLGPAGIGPDDADGAPGSERLGGSAVVRRAEGPASGARLLEKLL
jgi:hypothetical protein